jgi:hypothetical protein
MFTLNYIFFSPYFPLSPCFDSLPPPPKEKNPQSSVYMHPFTLFIKSQSFSLPNGYSTGFHTAISFDTTVGVREADVASFGCHEMALGFLATS